ncbi:MAG: hypothetical protein MK212_06715 [Saprospiraceae bacterium]|nr:hypothetical protein [Saprospiraceae bacterium]
MVEREHEEGNYYRFDVLLDPNVEEFDDVFTYTPSITTILDEDGILNKSWSDDFREKFIIWIKDSYYDSYDE